jgi:uncharacterized membrane protein YdjX (TVP38/TMEM64 family)
MKRLISMFVGLCIFFLLIFLVCELLNIEFLKDPSEFLNNVSKSGPGGKWMVATITFSLLIADIVLPLPSNIIMTLNGKFFGLIPGAILSFVAYTISAQIAYYLGAKSKGIAKHLLSEEELSKGKKILRDWGLMAIILSRPIPILAESICIVAGASSIGWKRLTIAAAIGSLPPAVIYAYAGSKMQDGASFIFVFGVVIGLSIISFIIAKVWQKRTKLEQEE